MTYIEFNTKVKLLTYFYYPLFKMTKTREPGHSCKAGMLIFTSLKIATRAYLKTQIVIESAVKQKM